MSLLRIVSWHGPSRIQIFQNRGEPKRPAAPNASETVEREELGIDTTDRRIYNE